MRMFLFVFFFLIFLKGIGNNSAIIVPAGKEMGNKHTGIRPVLSADGSDWKVKDLEKFRGKKFTFREKVAIKLFLQKKKQVEKEKPVKQSNKGQSRRSKTALWLGIFSLLTVIFIPVSVILAVISIILSSKSLKENNEDKKAKTALGLSLLTLGIIVVGLLIWGIFVSDGAFKLFTIG